MKCHRILTFSVLAIFLLLVPPAPAQSPEPPLGEVVKGSKPVRHAVQVVTDDDLSLNARSNGSQDPADASEMRTQAKPDVSGEPVPQDAKSVNAKQDLSQSSNAGSDRDEEEGLKTLIALTSRQIEEEESPGRRDALQRSLEGYRQRLQEIEDEKQKPQPTSRSTRSGNPAHSTDN